MKIRHRFIVMTFAIVAILWGSVSYASEGTGLYNFGRTFESTRSDLLNTAAFFGNLGEIAAILAKGTDVNGRDEDGYTPLIWAQLGDRPRAVGLLLDKGADINGQDGAGYTALHQAALAGREGIVATLLARRASVETVSRNGRTPLMDAADRGRFAIVKLLLAHGADPKSAAEDGETAASLAERSGHRNVALLVRGSGAEAGAQDKGVMEARAPGTARSENANSVCPSVQASPPEGGQPVRDDRPPRELIGAREVLREALETWEQIQARYPDADKRLRQFSQQGMPPEQLSQVEPLVNRAREIWQRLQREHPALAAQLLNLAGISR